MSTTFAPRRSRWATLDLEAAGCGRRSGCATRRRRRAERRAPRPAAPSSRSLRTGEVAGLTDVTFVTATAPRRGCHRRHAGRARPSRPPPRAGGEGAAQPARSPSAAPGLAQLIATGNADRQQLQMNDDQRADSGYRARSSGCLDAREGSSAASVPCWALDLAQPHVADRVVGVLAQHQGGAGAGGQHVLRRGWGR